MCSPSWCLFASGPAKVLIGIRFQMAFPRGHDSSHVEMDSEWGWRFIFLSINPENRVLLRRCRCLVMQDAALCRLPFEGPCFSAWGCCVLSSLPGRSQVETDGWTVAHAPHRVELLYVMMWNFSGKGADSAWLASRRARSTLALGCGWTWFLVGNHPLSSESCLKAAARSRADGQEPSRKKKGKPAIVLHVAT